MSKYFGIVQISYEAIECLWTDLQSSEAHFQGVRLEGGQIVFICPNDLEIEKPWSEIAVKLPPELPEPFEIWLEPSNQSMYVSFEGDEITEHLRPLHVGNDPHLIGTLRMSGFRFAQ